MNILSEEITADDYLFLGVAWSGTQYVAASNSNTAILHSADGSTWTKDGRYTMSNRSTIAFRDVAWGGGRFVAVGGGSFYDGNYHDFNLITHSTDGGSTWTEERFAGDHPFAAAWNGTRWVVVGENLILHSTDGSAWTADEATLDGVSTRRFVLYDVAWGDGHFVAVGRLWEGPNRCDALILRSVDGITWTKDDICTSPLTDTNRRAETFSGVAWNGTHFVVVGRGGTILRSNP